MTAVAVPDRRRRFGRSRAQDGGAAAGRGRRARLLFALLGLVSLLVLWEIGSVVVAHTSRQPNNVWPSLQYVAKHAYPQIGLLRGSESTATTASTPGSSTSSSTAALAPLSGHASYWNATVVLAQASEQTIVRVLLGSLAGVLLGVVLGIVIARTRRWRRAVYPAVNLLRQLPLLAVSIIFVLWFGSSEKAVYTFVIFGVATMIMINTVNAVRNIPHVQVDYARSLGTRRTRLIRSVLLPAVTPELIAGVKVAVGLAWAMVLGAEYVAAVPGLGRLMLFFELFGFTGRMVVVLFLLVAYALISHTVLTAVGNHLTRWVPRGT